MQIRVSRRWAIIGLALAAMVGSTAGACDVAATPSAMCAYVVNDGEDGRDANVAKIFLPGNRVEYDSTTQVVKYVPCNSRNYLINDGTVVNANGDKVGDRFTLSLAYTATGAPIRIWSSSYWTLNQTESSMKKFYELCYKYSCDSDNPLAGTANYSEPGWNGVLGENFGSSVDKAALWGARTINDDIWRKHDAKLYEALGKAMSEEFKGKVRAKTGFEEDLFCGSGNSGWDKEHKNFTCSNVRIEVDRVERDLTSATPQDRLAAAKELYGPNAGDWLGLQDSIAKCKAGGAAQTSCQVNLGGYGGGIPVPATKQ